MKPLDSETWRHILVGKHINVPRGSCSLIPWGEGIVSMFRTLPDLTLCVSSFGWS